MLNCIRETFTIYKTPKLVKIKSTFLATTYLGLVVTVWVCYLGSYELDLRKIYQKTCKVSGSVLTKTKGALSTEDLNDAQLAVSDPELYKRFWDNSDLVFLSHGSTGGFFVTTNLIITSDQSRGRCVEVSKSAAIKCSKDSDCKKGFFPHSGHGLLTGVCAKANGTCEVAAWCPIEEDKLPLNGTKALLEGTKDFTVMIKNSIEFPDCGPDFRTRNILANTSDDYLKTCIFDKDNDTNCPIFRIGDIVKWSNENFSKVAITGGVFQVDINWNCNFDWGHTIADCFPKYTFSRIDASGAEISPGWNFRVASYEGAGLRTLTKYYGLKIAVSVSGEGKIFDFLTLVLTIGATIGFFSVAPLVCDMLLDLFSKLKKCHPFHLCLSKYSAGARVEGHKIDLKSLPVNLEMYNSNATISTGIGDSCIDVSKIQPKT